MKSIQRILFIAITGLFLFVPFQSSLFGQITSVDSTNYTSPPKQWEVCYEDTFEIDILLPVSYSAGDTIKITPILPTGILGGMLATTNIGTLLYTGMGTSAPVYKIISPSNGSQTIKLQITLKADCPLFSAVSTPSFNINIEHYNGLILQSSTIITIPSLLISGGQMNLFNVVNQYYNLGQLGVPFARRFTYVNTGNLPFTGSFTFTDTVQFNLPAAAVRLRGISIPYLNPGSTSTVTVDNDSIVSVTVNLLNLAPDDSVIIADTLEIIACPSVSLNNSVTWYKATYGCTTGSECQILHVPSVDFTTAQFNPNDAPEITYRDRNPKMLCPANPDFRRFVLINDAPGGTAVGSASGASFIINKNTSIGNHLSYVDPATVNVYKFISGVPVLVPHITTVNVPDLTGITAPYPTQFTVTVNTVIPHGDSLKIEFTEDKLCIDSTDYGYYYNSPVFMDMVGLSGRFLHPCNPTPYHSKDASKTLWNESWQMFKLGQFFNNLTGTLTDLQEIWMDVNNTSRLFIGEYHPYFQHEVYIDTATFQIEVELELDSGLCLIADSIYLKGLGVNAPDLYPEYVTVVPGDGVNRGTNDNVRARFKLPPNYFLPNTPTVNGHYYYNARLKYSAVYDSLFNNFAATFKLQAKCIYSPPGGFATIKENFFIIYDTTCTPQCKIPLASVSDEVNINCPGCYLPGWNLSGFSAKRLNLGTADNNNNNYPDVVPLSANPPANTLLAHEERVMKNDTMQLLIAAHTSDGANLTFSTIGFQYKFGQLSIQGPLMDDLEFLGGTGNYTISFPSSSTMPFNIPPSAGNIDAGGDFYIMLDKTDWASYGLDTTAFFTQYDNSHSVNFDLKFRVKNNLNNGTGADPYFSMEGMNGFIYMSGTDFDTVTFGGKVDALVIPQVDIENPLLYNTASLAQLLYWCTGWEGRIITVGADYHTSSFVHDYWGRVGYGPEIDPCLKTLQFKGECSTGQPANGMSDLNQNAMNSFSFELRNLWQLDSIDFTIPGPYDIERFELRYQVMSSTGTSTIMPCGEFEPTYATYSFTNPADTVWLNDTTIRIFPWKQIQNIIAYTNCATNTSFYDESKIIRIRPILKMRDCVTTPKVYNFSNYPVTSYWTQFPISGTNDTVIVQPVSGQFSKPFLDWQVQVLNVSNTTPGSDLVWTINVGSGPNANNTPSPSVNNAFFWFGPASGGVNINTVQWTSPLLNAPVVGSHNGLPIYGLGKVGTGVYNGSFGGRSGSITVKADYSCAGLNGPDSLMLIFGDNCYSYPDSLVPGEVCFMDTIYIPIPFETPGLQITTLFPDTISDCDTNGFQLAFNASGTGNVENITVEITTPNNSIQYIPGSGSFTFGTNSSNINPSSNIFDLSTISYFNNSFNSFSPFAYLNFDMANWCNYDGSPIDFEVIATNWCGDTIGPFNFSYTPAFIISSLEFDSLTFGNNQADTISGCGDSSLVTIVIVNSGSVPSSSYDTLQVNLPTGTNYLNGDPYSSYVGQDILFGLNSISPGTTDTISFWINSDSSLVCGLQIIPIEIIGHTISSCNSITCSSSSIIIQDTIPLIIEMSSPVFTGINLVGLCSGDSIQVSLSNPTSVPANNLVVNFYCLENETGPLSSPCFLGSSSIITMGAYSSQTSTTVFTPSCGDCNEIMAVVQDLNDCICSSDTVVDAIDCDTVYHADANFTQSELYICVDSTINFTSLSSGGIHFWNFGDGNTSNSINPSHAFNIVGNFLVTHIVTDGPLSDTAFVNINVINCDSVYIPCCTDSLLINPAAHCSNIFSPVCGCDQVSYMNACIAEYVYGVSFWVNGTCSDSCNIQASFNYINTGMSVAFNNTTTGSVSYTSNWDFGDATYSNLQNPTHLFTAPGTYIVTLMVQEVGDSGCFSIICDTLYIEECSLTVNAGIDDTVCSGSCVLLNANPGTTNGSILWSPSIGLSNPNIANPLACPSSNTIYYLSVIDTITGCTGSDNVQISVLPTPVVSTSLNLTICQSGSPFLIGWHNTNNGNTGSPWFSPSPTSNGTISGPGLSTVIIPWWPFLQIFVFNPSIAGPGVHSINYTVTDPLTGCSATATGTVTVLPNPTVTISGNTWVCPGGTTTLTANPTGTGPFSYNWSNGATTQAITTSLAGPYTVTVTDANGCSASTTINVTLSAIALMNITTSNGTNQACIGNPYFLSATAGFVSYNWYNILNPSITLATSQNYSPTTSGTYCVYGVDAYGCNSATACITITIHPLPVVTPTNSLITVCINAPNFILGFHFGSTAPTYTSYFSPVPGDISSSSPGFLTSFFFDGFSPSLAGLGAHVINYSYTNPVTGCTGYTSMTINVVGPPIISFPPIANVELCSYDGIPISIPVTSTGDSCILSGPGVNPATNTFDPIAAGGVGTYTLTYTCTNKCGSSSATQTVTVTDASLWHQTTLSSNANDIINDITTDLQGNVYVTGSFVYQTTLNGGNNPDITINSLSPGFDAAFVAKYDKCANLIWVAHSTLSKTTTGKSIVLDESNGLVYITGDYSSNTRFNSSISSGGLCTSGYFQVVTGPNQGAYIAQYDMNTGCLYFVKDASINTITDPEALAVNKNTGEIFVAGKEGATLPGSLRSYIIKYAPTTIGVGGGLNPALWTVTTLGGPSVVNDLDFDNNNNRLWAIGSFERIISFSTGGGLSGNINPGITDAFVIAYNDGIVPVQFVLRKGNIPTSLTTVNMTGEGISVDDASGSPCFTGSYVGNVSVPFQLGALGITPIVNTITPNAYMICVNIPTLTAWVRTAEANPGIANGYAVDISDSIAYFTGNFNDDVTISLMPANPYLHVGGPGLTSAFRTYASAYRRISGSSVWTNITESPTSGSHTPTAMSIDPWNNLFISGFYDGEMSYYNGIPASGNLLSTGVGTNGYILREFLPNGEFRNMESENLIMISNSEEYSTPGVNVFPNPTNGIVNVVIQEHEGTDYVNMEIFNLTGQSVYKGSINGGIGTFDITHLSPGTYLLKVLMEKQPITIRIIKI